MTNYAFCRSNERPSIWERVHPFIIIIFFFFFFLPRRVFSAASSLLLFSRLDMHIRADYIRRVSRLRRENDVTALSGRPKRRDAATGTISRTVESVATVELIYEVLTNLKKQKKHRLFFLSFFPASLDLSDLPRFLMPLPILESTRL